VSIIHARWAVAAAILAALASGCAQGPPGFGGSPGAAPSSAALWSPPRAREVPPTTREVPLELPADGHTLTLPEVLNLALRNNADTRASWAAARSAEAAYKGRRGDWLPDVNAGADALRSQAPGSSGELGDVLRREDLSADLSFLLFNFGGRWAGIEESRQALLAADWTHNATVLEVIFDVEQSYYQYLAAAALRDAEQKLVEQTQANLEAAESRHDAGLATIADVLQARTARSQAQLSLDGFEGELFSARGALATSMGLPATTRVDVPLELTPPPAEPVMGEVERFLDEAMRGRPDLAAARARVEQSRAELHRVKTEAWPSITFEGSAGRSYFDDYDRYAGSWSAALSVRLPLFTNLSHHYDVRRAEADRDAAEARLAKLEQMAVLDVWTSFYDLKTARQRLATGDVLLESAQASEEVAAGRYREGVGSILDLLSAESALENARAQQILARSDWYISLARLSLATGALRPAQEGQPR
jgi:outer membrane protein